MSLNEKCSNPNCVCCGEAHWCDMPKDAVEGDTFSCLECRRTWTMETPPAWETWIPAAIKLVWKSVRPSDE